MQNSLLALRNMLASRDTRSGSRPAPAALHSRAIADLKFIRDTMASAATYTAFSGWGLLVVGLGALVTGLLAARESTRTGELTVWLIDGGISLVAGAAASILKARRADQPLFAGPIRKFSLSFAPTILVGAIVSFAMLHTSAEGFLPALWLLLYGAGLVAAGTQSIWIIPTMGACFFSLGLLALFGPAGWSNLLLTAGFSGLNAAFGIVIARRHGG